MQNIGLIANPLLTESLKLRAELADWLIERMFTVYTVDGRGGQIKSGPLPLADLSEVKPDIVIAVGGDGTLLHAARLTAPYGIPILGINMGRLGFLTEIEPPNIYKDLEQVFAGEYTKDQRMMLQAEVVRNGQVI